jgi:hypothetical protein
VTIRDNIWGFQTCADSYVVFQVITTYSVVGKHQHFLRKHVKNLGKNKNMAMGSDSATNQDCAGED